jgi:hypothetical protein
MSPHANTRTYNFYEPISVEVRNEVFNYCRLPEWIFWGYEENGLVYGIKTENDEITDECLFDVGDNIEIILRKMAGLS